MSDRYIDQIEKLLALSKSSNPHEAALALKRAHKLMQKYKIDLHALKACKFTELSLSFSRGINHKGISSSAAYIIKNLASCYVLGTKTPKTLIFIGDHASLLQAKYIFAFLDRALANAKKSYQKNLKESSCLEKSSLAPLMRHFPQKKLKNIFKSKPAKQSSGLKKQTDLYLIGYLQAVCSNLIVTEITLPADLAEFVNARYPCLKPQLSRQRRVNQAERQAFAQGLKDGERVKINKAVYGEDKNNYLNLY